MLGKEYTAAIRVSIERERVLRGLIDRLLGGACVWDTCRSPGRTAMQKYGRGIERAVSGIRRIPMVETTHRIGFRSAHFTFS